MKSNHRWIHQQASPPIPQPSNYSYLTEQSRRAGYVGPELGRTQHEHFQGLYPQPHPRPSLPSYAHDMHEAIQREIEKERIREEIIMSEIVRRRVLEAEVRRELMMERELALRRGSDGFPFGSSPVMGFDSQMRLPLLETRAEGRFLDERILLSPAEREKLNVRRENGGFENLPFHRGTADMRVSEVKPVLEGAREKEKIILLAKPDANISGSKRKAATPPPGVGTSDFPSDGILRKKLKEEWSCALCQVSATSERGLDEHLLGKKHKSKEAALKTQRAGKNYTIGLLPKKTDKSIQVVGTIDPVREDKSLLFKKSGEENLNSDDLKKNQLAVVQKDGDVNKKKHKFWCEMCQVGAHSQKVMNAHKRGKKHVSRLEKNNRKYEARPSNQEEKNVILMNHNGIAEDGKNKISSDVDEASDEATSRDHEPIETIKPEDHEPTDEAKPENGAAVDVTKTEDDEPVDEAKPEDGEAVDITRTEDDEPVDEAKTKDGDAVDITMPDVADDLTVS